MTRRERLEAALRRLQEHTDDPRACYWQIQAKVLSFVVSAYGDGLDVVVHPLDTAPQLPRGPGDPSPRIRSRQEIRTILERIAAANEAESRWIHLWRGLRRAFLGELVEKAV